VRKPLIPLCLPKIGVNLQFLENKQKSDFYTLRRYEVMDSGM
jgi:hypothetical protein